MTITFTTSLSARNEMEITSALTETVPHLVIEIGERQRERERDND